MRILFCDSVIDPKQVEPDFESERDAAQQAGFSTSLLSFESLVEGEVGTALRYVKPTSAPELALYRGWMLTPSQYETLYEGLKSKNITLITPLPAYQHTHYLPEWYPILADHTPTSYWTANADPAAALSLAQQFERGPIILKDYVKSEKHHWKEACYIPNPHDATAVAATVARFLELRGESLNVGLVFRQFETLQFLTDHAKSGMPLTKEYRLFFAQQQLVAAYQYWDEGEYGDTQPELDPFVELAKSIESPFFTMDVAQKETGEWIIMELGDGQVSGLPDHADRGAFYHALASRVEFVS